MTFPVIESSNEGGETTAVTEHTHNLPSGIVAGDLVVIFIKHAVACTLNAITDWTELVDVNAANGEKILWHVGDGTEGATLASTTSASTKTCSTSYRISGAADPTVTPPQLSTVNAATSTQPDATICTPTGGAKDYLWITWGGTAGEEANDDTWGGAAPSGFANARYTTSGTGGTAGTNCCLESADQQLNAASLNAAAWGANAQSLAWRAYTMAIHPGPPPAARTETYVVMAPKRAP